ncbi:MAG: substrate-binding domain-containing protein [Erysipelotrichales bacterium]|nr:substrate-binding domain-containing protein [Erysipelotrichales bacterium]
MRKHIGYIPAVLFTTYYLTTGQLSLTVLFLLAILWIAAFLMHKGLLGGIILGAIISIYMIYYGIYMERGLTYELIIGTILLLFYTLYGIYLWKHRNTIQVETSEVMSSLFKSVLTIFALVFSSFIGILCLLLMSSRGIHNIFIYIVIMITPTLLIPLIWFGYNKKYMRVWLVATLIYCVSLGIHYSLMEYDKSITINTAPNINVHEYLPFKDDSKIVKYDNATLTLTEDLPVIDGAAALFPVYSAYVNAVYPSTTTLYDGTFEYNNTPEGYKSLALKLTDIFIGVYPSEEQKAYAQENNTTFKYTPIGNEAFVFFVHKDNPITSLTSQQIKDIYSGKITNWKEVGGRNEEIAAFQRNEGSGSQSMLQRFMGDTPIMEAPTELVNTMMSGIIEQVSNYRSKSNSIGFSFRYYVEGIIQNPDIKMIAIDGIQPTAENIKNGKYPIVTPIYAVTYEENTNENVDLLLEWILSKEGQYILEETGYVGIQ